MPKSKRSKVVHTSKTQKKDKELRLRLYANIQECIDGYPYLYVFSVHNMRNNYLKDVRTQLSNSRLFYGKTKVMALALTHLSTSTDHTALSALPPHLSGEVGLLFSPQPPTDILTHFAAYRPSSYARNGTPASRSFTLPAGTLYTRAGEIPLEDDVPLQHSVEPHLRKLGVPTRLDKGKVVLDDPFEVVKEGEVLGAGQAGILKFFGVTTAEFGVSIKVAWERATGDVQVFGDQDGDGEGAVNVDGKMDVEG